MREIGTIGANIKPGIILAIETSCDETSAAVIRDGVHILSNRVSSQIQIHERYGGVVPEVASRKHVESITFIIEDALKEAGVSLNELSAIAVTQGPGLVGALIVGLAAAKSMALALQIPLIGVHHIAGHIYANQLVQPIDFPSLALVVSGGHTELVYIQDEDNLEIMGQTRDDAVGEAYDKVARALSLPYPGGPHIDRLAQKADKEINFPRAWLEPESYDFSFSGLKSAVLNELNQRRMKGDPPIASHIAKGFQNSVVDVLVEKTIRAMKEREVKHVLLAGGVAANQGLRSAMLARCEEEGFHCVIPPLELCTDNAAMIGAAAFLKWSRGQASSLDIEAKPIFSLQEWLQQ